MYIFSDKYLEHGCASGLEPSFGEFYDGEVELDRAVLVDPADTGCIRSDIGSNDVKLLDAKRFAKGGEFR